MSHYTKYTTSLAFKGPMDTVLTANHDIKLPPSLFTPENDEVRSRKWSKLRLTCFHGKLRTKDVKQHPFLSELEKEKYNHFSETESKDHDKSVHRRHIRCRRALDFRTCSDSSANGHEEYIQSRDIDISVVSPADDFFRGTLHYRIKCLANISSHYAAKFVRCLANWSKRLQIQMGLQAFD